MADTDNILYNRKPVQCVSLQKINALYQEVPL